MQDIRIHAFNSQGRLLSITTAATGEILPNEWQLKQVQEKTLQQEPTSGLERYQAQQHAQWMWKTTISADMVAAALLSPDTMSTWDLFHYMRHLSSNNQNAQRYEIEFWRKVFYPLSCLVMLVLALPFAYLHFRSGQIAGHVFGGVLAGISFSLLNNVFGHIGNLQNWQPLLTSAAPALIYSAISLAAFWWMVLRR
jgi:lipopolysaccharide export system permease protein